MERGRLSSKNQVVIPAEVREILKLKPGDIVAFVQERDRIIIVKRPVAVIL